MIKYYCSPFEDIINDGLEFVIIWNTSLYPTVSAPSLVYSFIKYQYLTPTFTVADVIILQVWLGSV